MKIDGKKFAVVFYPNTRSKPKLIKVNGKQKKTYQLYVSVTYNRLHTQFRADYFGVFHPEEDFDYIKFIEDNKGEKISDALQKYEMFIYNVVKYELDQNRRNFKLAGLGKRLRVYSQSVARFLGKTLLDELDLVGKKMGFELAEVKITEEKGVLSKIRDIKKDVSVFDFISNHPSLYLPVETSEKDVDFAHNLIKNLLLIKLK